MDSFFMIVLLPIIGTLCSVTCYMIAEKKNCNPMYWALLGLVFGPLALPAAACLKKQPYPTN